MSDIATLKKQMEAMTAALAELTLAVKKAAKKSSSSSDDESVEKPKRALSEGMKAWGAFQKRVAAVLKEGEVPLKNYAENMQFCSYLKSVNSDYESWDNDEILEQRETWVKPEISKLAAAGKTKRPPSSKSSVASSSNDEAEKVVEEMEKMIKEEMSKEEKKKPKKKADKKPDEKAVEKPVEKPEEKEKKPRGRPPKKAVEAEPEEFDGDINAFKWKGKMFSKTTYNDVIDEDTYAYIGRWDESTNLINEKHPMPAYVKKLLAELEEANA
jgi:hypothetical protein